MSERSKRRLSSTGDTPSAKRQKMILSQNLAEPDKAQTSPSFTPLPTVDSLAKSGLQRGVALVLHHVGFDSASPEALESFTVLAETYLTSLLEDVRRDANAARRNQLNPTDFEAVLTRFNLTSTALKPHLKPPVPRRKRDPQWQPIPLGDADMRDLPYLGEELSGHLEKVSKQHIPKSFPDFPSIHTYRYTPEIVEAVSVPDIWPNTEFDATGKPPGLSTEETQLKTVDGISLKPPLQPHEIPRGDAKKLREAAAREARLGEEALRRLQRASKVAKQKELWAMAQRQPARRERMNMWEEAMRELLDEEGRGVVGSGASAQFRMEIADQSMVVDADMRYHRQVGVKGKA